MKNIFKYFFIFCVGGLIYMLIETIFNGSTHWTMGILSGICFILIGLIDSFYTLPLYKQMLMSAVLITALEFIAGTILNLGLKLNIWNYSHLPINILGQVCLPFSLIWFFLSLPAIYLDDWIRSFFFNEPPIHHRLF